MSLLAGLNEASVGEYYFALRNDPSLNNAAWSTFPAISTVDMSLNAITRCIQLEIDGQFLDASPTDLLLNGVPIATINNLSDIADWSIYPSLSGGVDMATFSIRNISGLAFTGGNVLRAAGGRVLVNGQDVVRLWSQYPALGSVNMGGHFISNVGSGLGTIKTGNDNNILVNDIDVVTKWSDFPAQSNVDMATNGIANAGSIQTTTLVLDNQNIDATPDDLFINGIPSGRQWSTLPAISDISMTQHSLQDVSSIDFYYGPGASVVLNASGGDLYANGTKLAQGEDVNEWSRYPAVTGVNMNSNSIGTCTGLDIVGTAQSNVVLTARGTTNIRGRLQVYNSTLDSASPVLFTDLTGDINVRRSMYTKSVFIGDSNTYNDSTQIYGACVIDGARLHGCTIGCLPVAGVNTMRLDILPVGVDMTSGTYISLNSVGAGNFACGGALALAAGTYVTLEHGFGLGSNGIFVQDTARDDQARMIFEFGGSVGNSIDNPSRAGRMEYYGTSLFVSNIGPNTTRYPRLPYLNITGVSSQNFYGGASMIAGPSGSLTISGNVTIPSLNVPGFVTNPLTADLVAAGFDLCGVGIIRADGGNISVLNSTNSTITNLNVTDISPHPIGSISNITMNGEVVFDGTYPGNIGARLNYIQTKLSNADPTTTLTLSGYLAFAPNPIVGNNPTYTSYIGPGLNGYSIEIGGSAEMFGDLNLTNHNLVNVGSASIDSLTMQGNLNMGDFSIDNVTQIATRFITGNNGGLSLAGTSLDFGGCNATNINTLNTRYIAGNGGLSLLCNTNLDFAQNSATNVNTINTRFITGNGGLSLSNTSLDFGGCNATNVNTITTSNIAGNGVLISLVNSNLMQFNNASILGLNVTNTRYLNGNGGLSLFSNDLDFSSRSATNVNTINTRFIAGNGGLSLSGTDLDFNSRKGTNIADPVAATDVANKQYVDGKASSPANSNFFSGTLDISSVIPVIVTSTSLTLISPSRIFSSANLALCNSGFTARKVFAYISINGGCNAPIGTTTYSNDFLTIPAQNLSPVLSAGVHTIDLLAYADESNTIVTSTYANLICMGGYG